MVKGGVIYPSVQNNSLSDFLRARATDDRNTVSREIGTSTAINDIKREGGYVIINAGPIELSAAFVSRSKTNYLVVRGHVPMFYVPEEGRQGLLKTLEEASRGNKGNIGVSIWKEPLDEDDLPKLFVEIRMGCPGFTQNRESSDYKSYQTWERCISPFLKYFLEELANCK